jgi:hypothetical protein
MSRIENQIVDFRLSLEKAINSNAEDIEVTEIIKSLKLVPITFKLLKGTKIHETIKNIKNKYSGKSAGKEAKLLIDDWRQKFDSKPKTAIKVELKNSAVVVKSVTKEITNSVPDNEKNEPVIVKKELTENDGEDDEEYFDELSATRKKVFSKYYFVFSSF